MSDDRSKETQPVSPRVSILDPRFKYTSACATNVAATFERVRAEMAKAKPANVRLLAKRKEA